MNDMKETLAEIRRRGANRIRARKRLHSQIAALCVPLVLCVAALLVLPEFAGPAYVITPEETAIPVTLSSAVDFNLQSDYAEITASALLKVTNGETERIYTDFETVAQLADLLQACTESWQFTTAHSTDESRGGAPAVMLGEKNAIHIVLFREEETLEYVLCSRSLVDVQENIGYGIPYERYEAILEVLDMEIP